MDSIHDLGGVEGFGPLPLEANEPVFHHDWEGRVMAMRLLMGFWRQWTIDGGRHSVESLPPADYLTLSYYEKWLASLVNLSVNAGMITRDEVATGQPAPGTEPETPPVDASGFQAFAAAGRTSDRETDAPPAFAPGDRVRTNRHTHAGHTRLPRYARNAVGTVVLHHGAHVFPDTAAHGAGENPQHLYTVAFSAQELWGPDAAATQAQNGHSVRADLWESYLTRA